MISHLGSMLAPVVGAVYAGRECGEDIFGLAVIGDGGSSTGDFHESLNLASVRKIPVLFLIQNNAYAFSTPTKYQYNCEKLSNRATGYGIPGKTIDGTDLWEVYSSVVEAIDTMNETSLPYLLETMTIRMYGHAVYDNAEYVSEQEREYNRANDPVVKTRRKLIDECSMSEEDIQKIESDIDTFLTEQTKSAVSVPRCSHQSHPWEVFSRSAIKPLPPFSAKKAKNLTAVTMALDYLLTNNTNAILCGMDIGPYGSAFKTCKGLHAKFGDRRVMDMPLCESAITGFSLGASQGGMRPIIEFQFADFGTEAVTQLGLNAGTWFFRSGCSAPMLVRLPCGAGITLGAFHSGEFEGLWSRFPGLKLLYPITPQEMFEALVAGFYDPNPCIIFEHKKLYWSQEGEILFDGNVSSLWSTRQYAEGNEITIISIGSTMQPVLSLIKKEGISADIFNPFVLNPLYDEPVLESVRKTGRLLVVQESGETAGMGDRFISRACRHCFAELKAAPRLVSAPDNPVPFAPELEQHYIPSQNVIVSALHTLLGDTE
jgi:2-oxoisovalerate dehydrogenase E1 component